MQAIRKPNSKVHALSTASKIDVEKGADRRPVHGEATQLDQSLQYLYFPIYFLAVLTVGVGAFMYFVPDPNADIFQKISGTMLFACGIMLMMNSDLVVTTIRIYFQMRIFSQNNAELEKLVTRQGDQAHALLTVKSGLNAMQENVSGDMKRAWSEIGAMEANTYAKIRTTASKVCEVYMQEGRTSALDLANEFPQGMDILGLFFRSLYRDFDQRKQMLLDSIRSRNMTEMTTLMFAQLASVLLSSDPRSIPDQAKDILSSGSPTGGGPDTHGGASGSDHELKNPGNQSESTSHI